MAAQNLQSVFHQKRMALKKDRPVNGCRNSLTRSVRPTLRVSQPNLHLVWHDEGLAVFPSEVLVRFCVTNELLSLGIELQLAVKAIGDVAKMCQPRTVVSRFDGSVQRLFIAATNSTDEVIEVTLEFTTGTSFGTRLFAATEVGLLGAVSLDHHVALGPIEDVTHGGPTFGVGVPVSYFELDHLVFFGIEIVGREYFRRLLVIIPKEFAAHRDDLRR